MDGMNIREEIAKIRARGVDVGSSTLVKADTVRVVLMALKQGARLHKHHVDGRLVVQVLEGEVEFSTEEKSQRLAAGALITLEPMVQHEVAALQDAALLLTIAWPESPRSTLGSHRGQGYE